MIATAAVIGTRPGGIGASCASRLGPDLGVGGLALLARSERSVRAAARQLRAEQPELAIHGACVDLSHASGPDAAFEALRRARLPDGSRYLDGLRAVVFAAGSVVPDRGDPAEIRAMHAVKGASARRLVTRLARAMAAREEPTPRHIVLVGSLAALMPVPTLGEYCAANRALLALVDELGALRSRGVHCTFCAPGYVRGDLLWHEIQAGIPNPWARLATWYAADPPDRVAAEILAAVRAGERVVVPGANARALYRQFRLARSVGAEAWFRLAQDVAARWSGYGSRDAAPATGSSRR